jgi:cytochrome c peroxidase
MRASNLKLIVILAVVLLLARAGNSASSSDQFYLKLPVGIPADVWSYFIPKDNPLTAAKVELGRQLFFDKRLSADSSVSCATCHDPKFAFSDGQKTAVGIGGRRSARNTPTVLNVMFNSSMFWDGRADSLEAQARQPLINPDEMGNSSPEQVIERLGRIAEYREQFAKVFGSPVALDSLAKAIAAFERTLISGNSPLDRFLEGDRNALSKSAQRGLNLFRTKARCTVCHNLNQAFPFLTDGNYRNTGVAANFSGFSALAQRATAAPLDGSGAAMETLTHGGDARATLDQRAGKAELGRFLVTGNTLDIGAFRTPSLRNVELTAPYFHNGSAATLGEVIRFYARGGLENARRDWELQPISLTESEQQDLIEFLRALTSNDVRRVQQSN